MTYRLRPPPQETETRAQAICRRVDKATFIWLPLMLVGSFTIDGISTVFLWTMIARMVVWPLVGVNPLTCKASIEYAAKSNVPKPS